MKRSFVIALHIGYWLLYLLLITLLMLFLQAGGARTGTQNLLKTPGFLKVMGSFTILPAVIGFYLFYTKLFSKYLSTKRFALLGVSGLLTIFLAGIIGFVGLNLFTNMQVVRFNGVKGSSLLIGVMSILALIHGIIALVMKGFITWFGDIKVKEQLQQKNFETELALVKSQLSPHFLFNTINNIDVLIEKDAKAASLYLNRLSDIMRFMLYETKTEKIPLSKELTYINKYLELQKIRSANPNFVRYTMQGNPETWMIAPMLFIPFIENAFKHSGNKKSDHAILVNIIVTEEKLEFFCQNQTSEIPDAEKGTGGLGNDLIKKRLELLYPGKHTLQIERDPNLYTVHLSIHNHEN